MPELVGMLRRWRPLEFSPPRGLKKPASNGLCACCMASPCVLHGNAISSEVSEFQIRYILKLGLLVRCNNSNSTLAVRSVIDIHRFLQILSFFGKKIEKGLAWAGVQTWVQLIRSRLC